jgi:hypothetical protein
VKLHIRSILRGLSRRHGTAVAYGVATYPVTPNAQITASAPYDVPGVRGVGWAANVFNKATGQYATSFKAYAWAVCANVSN